MAKFIATISILPRLPFVYGDNEFDIKGFEATVARFNLFVSPWVIKRDSLFLPVMAISDPTDATPTQDFVLNWHANGVPERLRKEVEGKLNWWGSTFPAYMPMLFLERYKDGDSLITKIGDHEVEYIFKQVEYKYCDQGKFEDILADRKRGISPKLG